MPAPTSIAVVIPAYRVAEQIADVIAKIPPYIRHIIVVDDASPAHSVTLENFSYSRVSPAQPVH